MAKDKGQRSRSSAKKIDFLYVKINFFPFSNAIFKHGLVCDVLTSYMTSYDDVGTSYDVT